MFIYKMIYIIDANNLAGWLSILFEDDFDRKIAAIIKNHFREKGIEVKLVFDGRDNMGDRFKDGNIEIIYAPRDSYCQSADDKILEITKSEIERGIGNDQIAVVTNDSDLGASIKEFAEEHNYRVKLVKSSDFAAEIIVRKRKENYDEADRGLSKKEEDSISEDLLKLWGGK